MYKFSHHFNKVIYLISFFTLLIGFYLSEDGTGNGLSQDFYSTWRFVESLKLNFFSDPSEITLHFPLHYFLLSLLSYVIEDLEYLRFFFMIISSFVPYLFYKALKIKFYNANDKILILIACTVFFIPAFRYSAIWANDHITSLIFFLSSLVFYLKWETRKKDNNFNINIFCQILFMALAAYSRQYYAIFFLFLFAKYYEYLNFRNFLICLFISIFLSLPGFYYLSMFPRLFTELKISSNFSVSILANSSMLAVYIFPILFMNFLKKDFFLSNNKKFLIIIFLLSILITFLLSINFVPSSIYGYGIIYMLSNLLFNNNLIFLLSSVVSLFFIFFTSKESKYNIHTTLNTN